jgi:hypothetical protein
MKPTRVALLLLLLLPALSASVRAAGLARNENFVVFAPDKATAQSVLDRADQFREEVALEWLGQPLPPGAGRTVINVELSDTYDQALTLSRNQSQRQFHWMWLKTSRKRGLGTTLRHEITHVVFATHFANLLPAWADEGIASLSDNVERKETRQGILFRHAQKGDWPDLKELFEQETFSAGDMSVYGLACSVTEYLVSRGGKTTFLRFAREGKESGWEGAARRHYGFSSLKELQSDWESWASNITHLAAGQSPNDRPRLTTPWRRSVLR